MSAKKNRAAFFDRDGTINVEKNYIFKIGDFEFINGILELITEYQKAGFLIFIITNQSGLARGFYSEKDYQLLTSWMIGEFKSNKIEITKVYHCPHHPEITGTCECRKPKPGMILQAIDEYNIDPTQSVVIGDKKSDILAGKNAGIGKNLYIQDIL